MKNSDKNEINILCFTYSAAAQVVSNNNTPRTLSNLDNKLRK